MAIALDGRMPDPGQDRLAGQGGLSRFATKSRRYFALRPEFTSNYYALGSLANESVLTEPIAPVRDAALAQASQPRAGAVARLDPRVVKESFAPVLAEGPAAMEYFYSHLFTANPVIRALFPLSMTRVHERMFEALGKVIGSLDDEPGCAELLAQVARQHRRFGVTERHHADFFAALRDTVEHFSGEAWTAEAASSWQAALDFMAATMRAAAEQDSDSSPPWWIAEIVSHERRSPGVAVLRLQPSEPLPYKPGQYVPVQVTRWPREWRPYSIANAPRPGGQIELHVRAVPGGLVSNTLVHHSVTGDCVVLGPAAGDMTLADSGRDLLCVAGGTGLAPVKAIIEHALANPPARPRKITLFAGARQHFDLYDLEDLQLLESACPALTVIPVLSDEPGYEGLTGMLPDVVSGQGTLVSTEAYVCGPAAMVSRTVDVLAASVPREHIHHDPVP